MSDGCAVDEEVVRLQVGSGVASVTLNRPYVMNALSPAVLEGLLNIIETVRGRSDVRVLVLEGVGRAFSVGFDLRAMSGLMQTDGTVDQGALEQTARLGAQVISDLGELSAVTVASVHGFAVGGGLLLMAACDLRVVSDDLVCAVPEIDLGLPLMWGGVPLLMRELGPGLARDVIMTGRRFGAEELVASRLGLGSGALVFGGAA